MERNSSTRNTEHFSYVTTFPDAATEMIKLSGIEFNSRCIMLEEAKMKSPNFFETNICGATSPVSNNRLPDEKNNKESSLWLLAKLKRGSKSYTKYIKFF